MIHCKRCYFFNYVLKSIYIYCVCIYSLPKKNETIDSNASVTSSSSRHVFLSLPMTAIPCNKARQSPS